jgi:glucose/arabinose dehydrogenase
MKHLCLLIVLLVSACVISAQPRLTPHKITLKSGKSFSLNLPEEYEIVPAAEGLKRVRFFAKAPDGRFFVTDMYNLTDNKRGTVYILDGFNPETGKFGKVTPYMTNLKNPNSVQFYRDAAGQEWFYLAETDKLTRRKFKRGETKPTDTNPQTIAEFPAQGLSYKYGGWHLTRTIAFSPAGKLYVSVGSSCNSCVEKTTEEEKYRATVVEMNPDGTGKRVFARGLRNAVSIKWIGDSLFATNQGSDHLGLKRPDETFYALQAGADYGWPYCHSANGKIIPDPKIKRPSGCKNVTAPYYFLPARSSGMGFDLFDDGETLGREGFLVSLHGSTDMRVGSGYKVVIMRKGEKLQDFITGFLEKGNVKGRPCDIYKLDANSFFFTDDNKGIIYYVRKKGWTTTLTAEAETPPAPETAANTSAPGASPDGGRACLPFAAVLVGAVLRLVI